MKVLIVGLTLAAVATAAIIPFPASSGQYAAYPNDGRYYPDSSGQYISDASGQYLGDNSGAYVDDGSGRYNGDRGDNGGQYRHQEGPFGPGDGQYTGQSTNVQQTFSGYELSVPTNPLVVAVPVPTKTYLPVDSNPVSIPEPQPTNVVTVPFRAPVNPPVRPSGARGGGNYKWTLDQAGSHDVENPNYVLSVQLQS